MAAIYNFFIIDLVSFKVIKILYLLRKQKKFFYIVFAAADTFESFRFNYNIKGSNMDSQI